MGNLSNPNAFSGIVKGLGEGGSGNDFPVNITDPQEGQILTFDSVNEEWVNVGSNDDSLYDIIINIDCDTYGQTDETAPIIENRVAIKGIICNKSFDEMLDIFNNREIYRPKIKIIENNASWITNFKYLILPEEDAYEEIFSFRFTIEDNNNNMYDAYLIGEHFYVTSD